MFLMMKAFANKGFSSLMDLKKSIELGTLKIHKK
jgi:hypothetical protein